MKVSRAVVKYRIPILIVTVLLLIPATIGYLGTRVNYDMLDYLPTDMDTVVGQNVLMDEFGKGAFSFIIVEDMPAKDVAALKLKIENIPHVETVVWYNTLADLSVPMELLPHKIYNAFNSENATMMAVFFDSSTSADVTMDAIREIRSVAGKQCFVSGMSALVTDLKDLCEKEEPIYVAIAVVLALVAMLVFLDSWLVPFVFLLSIGMMILLNLGTNYFLGEISYITKALSAVLQLAVTMDYSIFLWHNYNEQLEKYDDKNEAMAVAIHNTFTSVLGSSVTTVAGFIALCFMSFTLGLDLGIVMAKGVVFGVIGSVTVLPAMLLAFDKTLQRLDHKPLLPDFTKLSRSIVKIYPILLIIFVAIIPPFLYGYQQTNNNVYYTLSDSLPQDMDFAVAGRKLDDDFGLSNVHMILTDANLDQSSVIKMSQAIDALPGIKSVLNAETLLGDQTPTALMPTELGSILKSDQHEMTLAISEYRTASDEMTDQINQINQIIKQYDQSALLVGESSLTVNTISIVAIFVIILIVTKSISLPVILIAVIESAIFVNLGLSHYFGERLSFIAPICISTIQLGATVDYAILMTTRYTRERQNGKDKKAAAVIALKTSIPSIIVSGAVLFAATIGVAAYSQADMISSLTMLMARGAIISIFAVPAFLSPLLIVADPLIIRTTLGMKHLTKGSKK